MNREEELQIIIPKIRHNILRIAEEIQKYKDHSHIKEMKEKVNLLEEYLNELKSL